MPPLRGVVVDVKGPNLVIKLESGKTINMPKSHGLNIGKQVLVTYDFTKNKARGILPDERLARFIEVNVEQPTPATEVGEIDSDIDISDSGALRPSSDDGFWRLWNSGILELSEPDSGELLDSDFSGILELSVPSFEGCGWHDPQ